MPLGYSNALHNNFFLIFPEHNDQKIFTSRTQNIFRFYNNKKK